MLSVSKLLLLTLVCAATAWPQQDQPAYRVLNATSDDRVEAQINEIATQGFAVVKFAGDPKLEYVIVLRRLASGEPAPTYRIFSRTVSDGKNFKPPSVLEQPLNDVGRGGYRVVPQTAVLRGQQLVLLLQRDEHPWEYRLTRRSSGKEADKELAEFGSQGFRPVEYLPERPFRSVLLEKQVDAPEKRVSLRTAGSTNLKELKKRFVELGMEGYRAAVASDQFDVVLSGGNPALPDHNVLLEGEAKALEATLRAASSRKLRLLVPLGSDRDRRGVFRGLVHILGGVFERSDRDYDYRVVTVANLNAFSRNLNQAQADGWELRELLPHWDPSDDRRMLAILEREMAATTK